MYDAKEAEKRKSLNCPSNHRLLQQFSLDRLGHHYCKAEAVGNLGDCTKSQGPLMDPE